MSDLTVRWPSSPALHPWLAGLLCLLAQSVCAQATPAGGAKSATAAGVTAAAPASRSAPKAAAAAKPRERRDAARQGLAPAAQKAVEERTPIEDEPTHDLSEAELEIARQVHVGTMACELGASVTVTPLKREGFFLVSAKGQRFRMHPTESRTGAIRLEDPRRGAMWLQLGNKSMLMSQKLGQRLADECQSPAQAAVAEHLKTNPLPNLLEPAPQPRATP